MPKKSKRSADKEIPTPLTGITGAISGGFSRIGNFIFTRSQAIVESTKVDQTTLPPKKNRKSSKQSAQSKNKKKNKTVGRKRRASAVAFPTSGTVDQDSRLSLAGSRKKPKSSNRTRAISAGGRVGANQVSGYKRAQKCKSRHHREQQHGDDSDDPSNDQCEMHVFAKEWNGMTEAQKMPYVRAEKADTMRYVGETMQYNMKKRQRRETAIRNLKEDISALGRQQIVERLKVSGKKPRRRRI